MFEIQVRDIIRHFGSYKLNKSQIAKVIHSGMPEKKEDIRLIIKGADDYKRYEKIKVVLWQHVFPRFSMKEVYHGKRKDVLVGI